jgi:hypothetical protein
MMTITASNSALVFYRADKATLNRLKKANTYSTFSTGLVIIYDVANVHRPVLKRKLIHNL